MMATEEQQLREKSDEEMIGGAFQHLIDTYAASRHRQKIDIITKAFNRLIRVCADSRENLISCTPSLWRR